MILGYDENNQKNEWYQNTFKDELHILNNNDNTPPPPFKVPKLGLQPPPGNNINMKIKEHSNIDKHRNIGNHKKKIQPGIKKRIEHFNGNLNNTRHHR